MLEANSSAEQLGIYAGVAGAGAIAGAAVVAKATSPLYKKDKKGKPQGKNTGAVNNPMKLATPVPESQRAAFRRERDGRESQREAFRRERDAKKSRSPNSNIDEMYKNAVDGPRADFGADAEFARQAQANQAGWEKANNVNDRGQLLLNAAPPERLALGNQGAPDVIYGGHDATATPKAVPSVATAAAVVAPQVQSTPDSRIADMQSRASRSKPKVNKTAGKLFGALGKIR